ncbi:hypothetical protein D3C80_1813450 [compost metagenome]
MNVRHVIPLPGFTQEKPKLSVSIYTRIELGTGKMMPCSSNIFRFGVRCSAKGKQVRLVAHQEISQSCEKTGVACSMSQHVGLQAA